jgi:ATP-dependent helicase/nuclease subunit B
MLKLLLGGSGSGKTTLLYQRIRARAEAGEKSILLVPEQFTSSTEGRIHRELGDALSGLVESFSFTSLAEHILSAEGGSAVQTLSDAGRAVLVRRALEELQDHVHYYYRHRRSAAFCQMAAETIDELKSAGLSGRQLYELAQDCGTDSAKLSELALIFQGYETLLAGTGMDPSDRLEPSSRPSAGRECTACAPTRPRWPGANCRSSCGTGPSLSTSSTPSTPRKSG